MNFSSDVDQTVIDQIQHFWLKVNERTLFSRGVLPSYDKQGDDALGQDVEYFHFNICADSRMAYLGNNIVLIDPTILSDRNKVCNAVIAHLYGGRCIHSLFTGISDPQKAHLDFERILVDPAYVEEIRANAAYAKSHGYKFYGTTELHTSLQTAARNHCRQKYGDPDRAASNVDIVEWVASWIASGLVDDLMYTTPTLAESFRKICTLPGVGAYYGYHLAVDFSLFHMTPYRHDEAFCVPGPGACETVNQIFPNLTKQKKFPYGEAVVWVADNQKTLFPQLTFHENLWNIEAHGKKLFPFEQDKLMTYGTEVGLCQFGVYQHLTRNPHLIERRTVGSDPDLTPIKLREAGTPVEPMKNDKKQAKVVQSKTTLLEF